MLDVIWSVKHLICMAFYPIKKVSRVIACLWRGGKSGYCWNHSLRRGRASPICTVFYKADPVCWGPAVPLDFWDSLSEAESTLATHLPRRAGPKHDWCWGDWLAPHPGLLLGCLSVLCSPASESWWCHLPPDRMGVKLCALPSPLHPSSPHFNHNFFLRSLEVEFISFSSSFIDTFRFTYCTICHKRLCFGVVCISVYFQCQWADVNLTHICADHSPWYAFTCCRGWRRLCV